MTKGGPKPEETLEALRAATVVGVVRENDKDRARAIVEGLMEGGLRAIEVTATTPGAFELIEALMPRAERGRITMGVGTIRTRAELDKALGVGARFVVSPHTNPELIQAARARGLVSIPGAMTPTEIMLARDAGADVVKIFPISPIGGVRYLRAIMGPLKDVRYWVSGDVSLDEIPGYLDAGAMLIGLTSALTAGLDGDPLAAARQRATLALEALLRSRDERPLLTISVEGRSQQLGLREIRRLPGSEHLPLESVVPGRRGHAVRARLLIKALNVPATATLRLSSEDGQSRDLSAQLLTDGGYIQFAADGAPLEKDQGGPLRLFVVGSATQCDNLKGLSRIEVLT